jgi:putative N6-adenine-specific DNA methylase
VLARASWRDAMLLNLHSRLAQRVLVQLSHTSPTAASATCTKPPAPWPGRSGSRPQTFKIEVTAQHSPLTSLNFAALKIKDAVADRFRQKTGVRPDVNTQWPDVRIYAHLTTDTATLYIDTSGEPLFKRGWREDKGEAPLKETLAAAMIAASGWDALAADGVPLYDPCCGSGTIAIEAAQIACNIAPARGGASASRSCCPSSPCLGRDESTGPARSMPPTAPVFGSDVAHRMVDFAERNAERAGVADAVQLRGGDALQRLPPCEQPGVMLLNPPYGERIAVAGVAGSGGRPGRGGFQPGALAGARTAQPVQTIQASVKPRTPTTAVISSPSSPATGRRTTPAGPPGC